MKTKILFVAIFAFFNGILLQAQFIPNGGNLYYNDGNVGIGTDSPSSALHIHEGAVRITPSPEDRIGLSLTPAEDASINFRPFIGSTGSLYLDADLLTPTDSTGAVVRFFRRTNTEGSRRIDLLRGNGSSSSAARITADGNNSFFNRYGGNVGIGTAYPSATLHVNGNFRLRSETGQNYTMAVDNGGDLNFIGDSEVVAMEIGDASGNVIIHDGRLGVGIVSPDTKLHVNGNFRLRGETGSNYTMGVDNGGDLNFIGDGGVVAMEIGDVTGNVIIHDGNLGVGLNNPNAKLHVNGDMRLQSSNGNTMRMGVTNDGNLRFYRDQGHTAMVISDGTGAVGINVENIPAGYRLAVNGNVRCREVRVTNQGWADFVFADDYKLKSLEEVESFITENKHLPDVPSEKEVLANGTDLGTMDAILLQKIEELTLYMIELKKENEMLNKKLEQLKVR